MLLDIFEDQLDIGRLVTMADAKAQMDSSLTHMGRQVLQDGGRMRREQAEAKAVREYERFDEARRLTRQAEAQEELTRLKEVDRKLPKKPRTKNP